MRCLLLLGLFVTATAGAQTPGGSRFGIGGGLTASRSEVSRDGFVQSELAGTVFGFAGQVAYRRFMIEGTYAEGALSPPGGSVGGQQETFAELGAFIGANVGYGFTVGGGPRFRALVAPGSTVRWMRVEARMRYTREIVPGRAMADVDLWQVLSADVNAQGGANGGRGASAGISYQLPNSPFALRAAYTADRMAFASGTSEYLDRVELGLRYGRR